LETVAGEIVDRAVRNIITLILCFSGLVSLVVWFLRESGHTLATKRVVGYGLVVAIAAGVALFRIERVSGDLVPELRLRWMPARDRMLPPAQVAAAATVAGSSVSHSMVASLPETCVAIGPETIVGGSRSGSSSVRKAM